MVAKEETIVLSTTTQNLNQSLLQKISIDRRTSSDDIHPLSLIMMDLSSFITTGCDDDCKQKKVTSAITKILNNSARKSDIKTCIHKSNYALFLPNTLESGAFTLSDRIHKEIKKVINKHQLSIQKNDHILFQISTYLKTSQGSGEPEVFNGQYKKSLI